MSVNTNRQPAGTPTGGQFAAGSTGESSAALTTDPGTQARDPREYTRALTDLNRVEAELAGQMATLRTRQVQLELARAVAEDDRAGRIPDGANFVRLVRDEDEVNDFGSADYTTTEFLDDDREPVAGLHQATLQGLGGFSVSLHADGTSPDMTEGGMIRPVDDDWNEMVIDLASVRDWAEINDPSDQKRLAREEAAQGLRLGEEMDTARDISDLVRDHYPDARYVELNAGDNGSLHYARVLDGEFRNLAQMYGDGDTDIAFDEELDEKCRSMTHDSSTASPDSWPSLLNDGSGRFDDHDGTFVEATLDLDAVDRRHNIWRTQ